MKDAKILIVDDEEVLCELLGETLASEGYIIEKVYDGQSAIDFIQDNEYDVAILDLFLPKKSGIDVLKYISENNKDIKVIMATGYSDMPTAVEALNMGAFDFLLKPFDVNNLKIILKRAIAAKYKKGADNTDLIDTFSESSKVAAPELKAAPDREVHLGKLVIDETIEIGSKVKVPDLGSEKKTIESVLKNTNWNKSKSSEILGVSLKTLYSKIKEYGLKP